MTYIDLSTQELQYLLSLFPSPLNSVELNLCNKLTKALEKDKEKNKYDFLNEYFSDHLLSQIFCLPETILDLDVGTYFEQFEGKVYLIVTKYLRRNQCFFMRDLMDITIYKLGNIRYIGPVGRAAIFEALEPYVRADATSSNVAQNAT